MELELHKAVFLQYDGDRDTRGAFDGHGAATLSSSTRYVGDWHAGRMHGSGTLHFPDGVSWGGDMKQDSITGAGVYRWSTAVYEGEVQNGMRHGRGVLHFTNQPACYDGDWRAGKRHGWGVLYYDATKHAYYEGMAALCSSPCAWNIRTWCTIRLVAMTSMCAPPSRMV